MAAPGAIVTELGGGLVVCRTGPEHAEGLEELQRVAFPTLADQERFKARHYLHHIQIFPEGQFCAIDQATPTGRSPPERDTGSQGPPARLRAGSKVAPWVTGQVVGMTTTLRLDFEPPPATQSEIWYPSVRGDPGGAHPAHTFAEIFGEGWVPLHQPDGRWLYGADVGTHPAYRRRGIARALYSARHDTVHRLGLAGQVTVGSPSGYGALADRLPIETYYIELLAGARTDPTISAQMRIGFEPRGIIPSYLSDPACAGYGILLVLPADREVPLPAFVTASHLERLPPGGG
jgi:GNAT superfamily N-acetyltransferase